MRWILYVLAQMCVIAAWIDLWLFHSRMRFFSWLTLAAISLAAGAALLIRSRMQR